MIARHVGPDPDAIASQTALRDSIRLTFPNKDVVAVGLGVSKFKYYGILDKIDNDNIGGCVIIDAQNKVSIDNTLKNNIAEKVKQISL